MQVRGSNKVVDQDPEGKYEALNKYARDLTAAAREGKLDPVIGRDDEIRRCIQILSRRTKNNPVLIGEPGGFAVPCSVSQCALHVSKFFCITLDPVSFYHKYRGRTWISEQNQKNGYVYEQVVEQVVVMYYITLCITMHARMRNLGSLDQPS
eukprot:GHUV01010381.1.p2 GENE.GHUV01010381.1~~GHUV01010381.1.p2  ORF type:complete len:152 (+),score=9.39 GHUV01010381.1:939-1394(+)